MAYGGQLIVAGGLQPGDVTTGRVWRIDPGTGKAHRLPDLAAPVHDVAGGVVAGRPTLVGGGSATSLSVVQRQAAAGTWKVAAHLPTARSDVSAVVVPGGLVAVGGYDGVHMPRAVLRTSDGRHFHAIARLPHGVRYAGVALLDGQLWVLGGEASGQELREVWRVDLSSGQVTAVGRLPGPLGHEAVIPVDGRLLVLGGRTTSSTMTNRMWWFTPATRTWRKAGRLPYPLADAPTAQLGGVTYLVGGETPHFTRRVLRVTVR